MTSPVEFPGNCSTNTYILQDFGEIAYIVCTVSIPPSSNHAVQIPPPARNIARLRRTESQFRQASILAVIDPDTSQLFTFYKKIDVLKDQKTLFKKFSDILRSNSCSIAYKTATRVQELFKPENAKLYKLFISAILSSIDILPTEDRKILRLGQRYHVIAKDSPPPLPSGLSHHWTLVRTDLQIIHTGHVAITIVTDDDLSLLNLSKPSIKPPEMTFVVIAPSAQVALQYGALDGSTRNWASPTASPLTGQLRAAWQANVTLWLKDTQKIDDVNADTLWTDLMLPVFEQNVEANDDASTSIISATNQKKLVFKAIVWPSHLCFIRDVHHDESPDLDDYTDPLQFVLEWMETAGERKANQQAHDVDHAADNDSESFAEESPFDSINSFQPFGPPPFAISQTVYPTPPDVLMAHATPGMSSVDGLAATPMNAPRPMLESQHGRQDVTMMDFGASQASGIGSGLYEDDLFDDMPHDALGREGGNEPNWDFFDETRMDVDNQKKKSSPAPRSPSTSLAEETFVALECRAQPDSTQERDTVSLPHTDISPEHDAPVANLSTDVTELENFQRDGSLPSEIRASNDVKSASIPRRRQSNLYDTGPPFSSAASYDQKYSHKGRFWFDSSARREDTFSTAWHELGDDMDSSSMSNSDVNSYFDDDEEIDDDNNDDDNNDETAKNATTNTTAPLAPEWYLYSDGSVSACNVDTDTTEISASDTTTNIILNLFTNKTSSIPLEQFLKWQGRIGAFADESVETQSILAQILVDQYTQASLIHEQQSDEHTVMSRHRHMVVTAGFDRTNSSVEYATLSHLVEIVPSASGRSGLGSLSRLKQNQIAIRRSDKTMVASPTILPFWDILALQPCNQAKDLTAYCLFSSGTSSAEACAHFLSRIAEAYHSCGLGRHELGKMPGLTSDGVFDMNSSSASIGQKLADVENADPALNGVILVYMVAQTTAREAYLKCCQYFMDLFASYRELTLAKGKSRDMVMQIVPASFLTARDALVISSQHQHSVLAREVYSRIPPAGCGMPGTYDCAVTLPVTTNSNFKFSLNIQPDFPASNDSNILHLAYCPSKDNRWLVASWTDPFGHKTMIMTYLVRIRDRHNGRSREEILDDLWQVSHDMMRKHRTKWRLVIARAGYFDATDLNGWMHLANGEAKTANCDIHLVSVDVSPALHILNPVAQPKTTQTAAGIQQAFYGTPASTPQAANITSPETFIPTTPTPGGAVALNAPTPSEHGLDTSIDVDMSLIDPVAESWAVILPFGANQSYNVFEVRPAIASGYLVKRQGTQDEDGTTSIAVHLVHMPSAAQTSPGQREEWLEEIIGQYRGLATLAGARGCIDSTRSVVPWHIHTSISGAEVLESFL